MLREQVRSGIDHVGLALREPEEFAFRWSQGDVRYPWWVWLSLMLTAVLGTTTYGIAIATSETAAAIEAAINATSGLGSSGAVTASDNGGGKIVLTANSGGTSFSVLDDATSAVDATKEHEIRAALAEVMEGRTTLVIAHRPATIALAEQVAVVEGGKIVEQGTHAELVARSPRYRTLLALAVANRGAQ